MTLDNVIDFAVLAYQKGSYDAYASHRTLMRAAVLAVLQAVKRECVPDKPDESESKEYQRGFYAACIDMDCNLDALMQEKV